MRWIGLYFRCLKKMKDDLAVRLKHERGVRGNAADLLELSLQVVNAPMAKERLTIGQLPEITGANCNMLKARLRKTSHHRANPLTR